MLNGLLEITQCLATHQQWPHFGQRKTPLSIHDAEQTLGDPTPEIDCQSVARADYIVRADRQVHGNRVWLGSTVSEYLEPESLRLSLARRGLHVHVVKRRDVRIGVGTMDHRHRRQFRLR